MISPRTPGETTRPEPRVWNIRQADGRTDAFYLVRLWHHYFGVEYEANWLPYGPYQVAGWDDETEDEDEETREACGVIATHGREDGQAVDVGGGLAELFDHDAMVEQLPDGRFDRDALAGQCNAMLWFGIVDQAWRGYGIGHRLFRARLEWAQARGADMVFSIGWERPEGRTSRPLFEQYDFVPVQRFDGYYRETRDACPDCGVWPNDDRECTCTTTLWARELPFDRLSPSLLEDGDDPSAETP
ncbi:GNAT family N-acetyltransferase [Natronorubrum sp. DTA7]|uniref:GNAT family N-acetyltransferase n=1 Tax=Natronorubrum sp. DTA7 TaxID=3447016 RepID=UPI003F866BD3